MLRALTTAATGMIAQQNYLDVIANNVANVNTTAFKQSRIEFQDLLSQATRTPGALMNQGTYQPVGIEIGPWSVRGERCFRKDFSEDF